MERRFLQLCNIHQAVAPTGLSIHTVFPPSFSVTKVALRAKYTLRWSIFFMADPYTLPNTPLTMARMLECPNTMFNYAVNLKYPS